MTRDVLISRCCTSIVEAYRRIYEMSFGDGPWRLWRNTQASLAAEGQLSEDHGTVMANRRNRSMANSCGHGFNVT